MIDAWHRLAPRDRRALGVLAGAVAAALAWSLLARPTWQRIGALRDALAVERALLTRERALLARGEAHDRAANGPVLFTGRDDAIAAAALAEHAGVLAESHDVWVQAATTGETRSTPDGLRLVRVDVRAEGDVQGVSAWLAALERGPRAIRVATLELSAAPGDGAEGTEPLALRATLVGYAAPASLARWPTDAASARPRLPTSPDSIAVRITARNPFGPARRAPAVRYRLAIPDDALAAFPAEDAPDAPPPVVLGTAVGDDGAGFAMCAIEGQPVAIVRRGDRLADYTVIAIARGRVTFRDARGRRLDITTSGVPDGDPP